MTCRSMPWVQLPVNSTIAVDQRGFFGYRKARRVFQTSVDRQRTLPDSSPDVTYLDAYYGNYPNASPTYSGKAEPHHPPGPVGPSAGLRTEMERVDHGGIPRGICRNQFHLTARPQPLLSSPNISTARAPTIRTSSSRARFAWTPRSLSRSPDRRWGVDLIGKNLTKRGVIPVSYGTNNTPRRRPGADQRRPSAALQVVIMTTGVPDGSDPSGSVGLRLVREVGDCSRGEHR